MFKQHHIKNESLTMTLRLCLTLLISASLFSACGASDNAIAISKIEGDPAAGQPLYEEHCSSCHGAMAGGGSGPNLIKELKEHDLADMIDVVLEGDGSMPSFEYLEDQKIADIMAYIKSL